MRNRLIRTAAAGFVLVLAAFAARVTTAGAADSGAITVAGPWTGQNAASFKAVLAGFTAKNPGVTVNYKAVTGDVADALKNNTTLGGTPDAAVLTLPNDQAAMVAMKKAGTLKSLDFIGPTVSANYAYSWKLLGSVGGQLTGLFVNATDRSAFWYEKASFKNLGLTAPTTWAQFQRVAAHIRANGLSPFAISGGSQVALPNLFENLYLMLQGNRMYDKLATGTIKWTDPTVANTLGVLKRNFGRGLAGGGKSLNRSYANALRDVFGSPLKAYMVPGGSAALPIVASANVYRPLSQFSAFAFPHLNAKTAPRVIGDADAIVLTKDSPATRALVGYLATPEAATIWAKQGGDFLSPNRKVASTAYAMPQMGELAQQLTSATTFRFPIADTESAAFRQTMNLQLQGFLRNTYPAGDVMIRLALAAGQKP